MSREKLTHYAIVNAFFLRQHVTTNTDIYNIPWRSPGYYEVRWYVPDNEIWFDRDYKEEIPHLLKIIALGELASFRTYDEERTFLKKYLLTPFDSGIEAVHIIRRTEKRADGMTVQYVDGAMVRKRLDPHFSFGGHGYVYDYISRDKVWIDDRVNFYEQRYILHHELVELALMKQGRTYDYAHGFAVNEESELRRKDGAAYPGENRNPIREGHWTIEQLREYVIQEVLPLPKNWNNPEVILGSMYREILRESLWQDPQQSTLSNQTLAQ